MSQFAPFKVRLLDYPDPDWDVWDVRDFEGNWVAQVRLNHKSMSAWVLREPNVDFKDLPIIGNYQAWWHFIMKQR